MLILAACIGCAGIRFARRCLYRMDTSFGAAGICIPERNPVTRGTTSGRRFVLDISGYAPGMYIVECTAGAAGPGYGSGRRRGSGRHVLI